jgi:hypothetical protein
MKRPTLKTSLSFFLLVWLITSACGLASFLGDNSSAPLQDVEDQVAATVAAMATEAVVTEPELAPTATDEPILQSSISGQLSFPGDYLPPLRVVAFDVDDLDTYFLTEVTTGDAYSLAVPPSTYYILAYPLDEPASDDLSGFAGAYSQAVLCGLHVDCTDHRLIPVQVSLGQQVTGIDPADWYLPIEQTGEWPADPTREEMGTIRGNLGYPSDFIPPLRVVAFNIHTNYYYYVDTQTNQFEYEIPTLPPGTYQVVAYVREDGSDFAGGYSYFVTCGLSVECENHDLIDVIVAPGGVVEGVDPVDFYAPPGETTWPENPTD